MPDNKDDLPKSHLIFALLSEVGIIAQLSRTMLEVHAPAGLTMPMFGVLNHLSRVPEPPTPIILAQAFQLPKTSMTHTLMTLEKRGFVEMRPNLLDGRSKLVHLLEPGRKIREQVIAVLAKEYSSLSEQIDISRIAEALPVLTEVRQYLDKLRD